MTTRHTRRPAPRPRLTVALTGTSKSTPAHLSFDAEMALLYAGAFLFRSGRIKVPASGIVRAALVAYAARLDANDEGRSFREAKSACAAGIVAPEDRQMVELRLHSVPAGEALPSFAAILRGHGSAAKTAQLTAQAEALAATCRGAGA